MPTYKYSAARPADTNLYAANDVVLGVLTFRNSGLRWEEYVTDARLEIGLTSITSGMTSYRLYLHKGSPPSALADNAAFDYTSADRATFIDYIDLGSPADLGSTLACKVNAVNTKIGQTEGLYGYLVTNGTYTPAASTVYTVTLETVTLRPDC